MSALTAGMEVLIVLAVGASHSALRVGSEGSSTVPVSETINGFPV